MEELPCVSTHLEAWFVEVNYQVSMQHSICGLGENSLQAKVEWLKNCICFLV